MGFLLFLCGFASRLTTASLDLIDISAFLESVSKMIWCCFLVFAASLPTALASPFPQDSVNLFDPDLETQPGFSTAFPVDESISWNTDLSPEAGDNSNLFSLLPDPTTADGAADQFLASSDLEGSALTSDSSSCGTQDSSGALPTDAQVALDMLNSNSLDARGFFDDVDKLQNEVIDPPSDPSCAAPNSVKSPGEKFPRPNVYRKIGLDVTPLIEDETKTIYPVDEFGKCPVLEPDYTEALCCTGQQYGIYVLRCAPGTRSSSAFPSSCQELIIK